MSETEFYFRSVTELDGLALDFAVAKVLNTLNEEGRPRIRYTKNPAATFSLMHAHTDGVRRVEDTWYSGFVSGPTPTIAVLRAVYLRFTSGPVYLKPLMRATGKALEAVLTAP